MMRAICALGVVVALALAASADEKKAAPAAAPAGNGATPAAASAGPPKPAAELAAASKYFIGSWKCEGTMPAGPWGPGGKASAKLSFKMTLGDFFMGIDGDMAVAGSQPMKTMFQGINGYDPMSKKLTRVDFDSMGAVTHFTSNGWDADKLVFDGEGMMMGQKMKVRHTMTKKSDTEFTSSFVAIGPDGKAAPMGDDTCKKAGKK